MATNLESSNLTAEKVESRKTDEPQVRWNEEFQLTRKIEFQPIEREYNLKQQGMLPTLELIAEPRGIPGLDGDKARKPGDPAQWKGSTSLDFADGSAKPGDPANWKDGDNLHYADGTSRPGDPANWKDGDSLHYADGTSKPGRFQRP